MPSAGDSTQADSSALLAGLPGQLTRRLLNQPQPPRASGLDALTLLGGLRDLVAHVERLRPAAGTAAPAAQSAGASLSMAAAVGQALLLRGLPGGGQPHAV